MQLIRAHAGRKEEQDKVSLNTTQNTHRSSIQAYHAIAFYPSADLNLDRHHSLAGRQIGDHHLPLDSLGQLLLSTMAVSFATTQ